MKAFVHDFLPGRVIFGAGSIDRVCDEVASLGGRRVFLVHDVTQQAAAGRVRAALEPAADVCAWSEVVQHVPVDLAARAREAVDRHQSDVVVSIGGGSSTGLAKAVALSHGLPIVAVPTTYAGSEMTPIYGLTGGQNKQTGSSAGVLPRCVVYDPDLTLSLPPFVTGPSAFNALAHCVEALYATGHDPVTSVLALEGVRVIRRSLPAVMKAPRDTEARGELLFGAMLGGMSLGYTSSGLHHRICHILGGRFNTVHADTHSVILPHAVAFNAAALPDEMSRLADAFGVSGGDPAGAIWDLARESDIPTSLQALGLTRDGLADVASQVVEDVRANPWPLDESNVLALLEAAFDGVRPSAGG